MVYSTAKIFLKLIIIFQKIIQRTLKSWHFFKKFHKLHPSGVFTVYEYPSDVYINNRGNDHFNVKKIKSLVQTKFFTVKKKYFFVGINGFDKYDNKFSKYFSHSTLLRLLSIMIHGFCISHEGLSPKIVTIYLGYSSNVGLEITSGHIKRLA